MRATSLVLLLVGLSIASYGQVPKAPEDFGLISYSITNDALGEINFYVTKTDIEKRKPLLLFLDGSGHYPIYSLINKSDKSQEIHSSIPLRYNKLANTYHVVLISKPGTPFLDSLEADSHTMFMRSYQASEEYNDKLSLGWRVGAASQVIDYLIDELETDQRYCVTSQVKIEKKRYFYEELGRG